MEVIYSDAHWELLKRKRDVAKRLMEMVLRLGMREVYVYGSVARGDVREDSDVDVVVFDPDVLKLDLLEVDHKLIVQATPRSTPKAYLSLDPEETQVITFPLAKLTRDEVEFFSFGGKLDYEGLLKNVRVPGVNKDLFLIVPTERGHVELPLKGNEDLAAKYLGISIDTILQRERLLTRREEIGRTGVFLKYELSGNESVLEAVRSLYKNNKFFRRVMDERQVR
ncbi:MAG: nucleotidyltransferase domain-containing protein [Thermoprotei archaeon]